MVNFFNRIILFLFLFFTAINAHENVVLKKVTLQLSWFNQFQFAGYYIAKEKGFYEEAGFDVEILPFKFGLDIPSSVSNGDIDFAIGRETLILDKSKGQDIVALYALFQATPLVLLSTKESNIDNIEKFKFKNVMTTIDDASEVSLKAMIKSHNVKLEDMNFLKHSHKIDDLINKKTDLISAYISKSPYYLKKMGIEYNTFDPKNFGFDMYSDFLYTSSKLINDEKNHIDAFKKASLRGWLYAYANTEESVNLILEKYNTQNLSKEELHYEAKELKKLSFFNTKRIGEIKEEKLQRVFDLYNIMGLTSKNFDLSEFIYKKNRRKIKLTKAQEEYLNNKREILFCAIPNAMPHSYIKDGKIEGFVKDFVKLLEMKLEIDFKLVPTKRWVDSLDYVKNKKCDLIPGMSLTEKRKSYLNFTDKYTQLPVVLITNNKSPFIENLKSIKNHKIGITKGFALHDEFVKKYKNIKFVEVPTTEEGLKRVKSNELHGQITSMGSAWYYLLKESHENLKISSKLEEKLNFRVGIRKNDIYLYEILNEAIKSIDKEEIRVLENKWAYIEYEKEYDYTLFWQILLAITLLLAFILYRQHLLKNINSSLNKLVEEKTLELVEINHSLENRIKEEVEKNLKKDRLLAQQSKMASMGEMIENIAHQWRQPLSVISTGASGIKIKKQFNDLDDELLLNTLDTIINSSQYLSHTIDDFRNFFKPNKQKNDFYLDDSLNKTINLINSKFESQNIDIIQNMEKIKVYGFETELIQVFINILNNAKDALESSNNNKKLIFVNIEKENNKIIVSIKDNAGGINPAIIDKIFEPYFTTKHKKQGTGIGLYMSEQIISKYMNGNIEALNTTYTYNDRVHTGALFRVVLDVD